MSIEHTARIICDSCNWNTVTLSARSHPASNEDLKREASAKGWLVAGAPHAPLFYCKTCKR